jgi:hypothetical protein
MSSLAIIPVSGRLSLLEVTIRRALRIVDKVICVVSDVYERKHCPGAETISIRRKPLGEKWNFGFQYARQYDPDFVLFIGSSDWVSDNWMDVLLPEMGDSDFVGVKGFNLLHLDYEIGELPQVEKWKVTTKNMAHIIPVTFKSMKFGVWRGYEDERKGEPIGIGRILSRDLLKRVDYKPFNDESKKGMDLNMVNKAKRFKLVDSPKIKCLSLSTNLWGNFHQFEDGEETKENGFLDKWFPEYRELTEWKEVKLNNSEARLNIENTVLKMRDINNL